jgi:hypothetical protein
MEMAGAANSRFTEIYQILPPDAQPIAVCLTRPDRSPRKLPVNRSAPRIFASFVHVIKQRSDGIASDACKARERNFKKPA